MAFHFAIDIAFGRALQRGNGKLCKIDAGIMMTMMMMLKTIMAVEKSGKVSQVEWSKAHER